MTEWSRHTIAVLITLTCAIAICTWGWLWIVQPWIAALLGAGFIALYVLGGILAVVYILTRGLLDTLNG